MLPGMQRDFTFYVYIDLLKMGTQRRACRQGVNVSTVNKSLSKIGMNVDM